MSIPRNLALFAENITSGGVLNTTGGGTGTTTLTGTGNLVLSNNPVLVAPALGTIASGVATNLTGLPLTTGVTGILSVANGGSGVSTSTGTGNNVLSNNATLVAPVLGTPASGVATNLTGLPLTTGVTGTLPIANGGTNATTATGSAGQLQYLTSLTGGSARTYQAKFADVTSVKDFGAKGDGTTDDTTAVQAAITAGGFIYFPPGTYKLSSQITYTMPASFSSINIFGAGAEVTRLVWAAGGGMIINHIGQYNSTRVRDLCFQVSAANTGTALQLYQTVGVANPADSAPSEVTNCIFRGSDAYAGVYCWAVGVQAYSVSNVNFNGCGFFGTNASAGIGVLLSSISGTYPGGVYNFQSCFFNFINYGIDYGNYVQGVTVNQCNFTGAQQGIIALASLTALDQLVVTNSQFECSINGILTATAIPNTQISGCLFIPGLASSNTGINLQQGGLFTIVGNSFNPLGTPTGATGISIGATVNSWPGTIVGNTIYGMSNAGIVLGASASRILVQSNTYLTNATNVVNSGSNNLIYDGGYAYTVSILPTVGSYPYVGLFVTDATVTASGNFGAAVTGGGANKVPVYSDGTNWRIG